MDFLEVQKNKWEEKLLEIETEIDHTTGPDRAALQIKRQTIREHLERLNELIK